MHASYLSCNLHAIVLVLFQVYKVSWPSVTRQVKWNVPLCFCLVLNEMAVTENIKWVCTSDMRSYKNPSSLRWDLRWSQFSFELKKVRKLEGKVMTPRKQPLYCWLYKLGSMHLPSALVLQLTPGLGRDVARQKSNRCCSTFPVEMATLGMSRRTF